MVGGGVAGEAAVVHEPGEGPLGDPASRDGLFHQELPGIVGMTPERRDQVANCRRRGARGCPPAFERTSTATVTLLIDASSVSSSSVRLRPGSTSSPIATGPESSWQL